MKTITSFLNGQNSEDQGKLLLRFILGFGMLFHGYAKLMGGAGHIASMLGNIGIPSFIGYGAILGEFIAPLMILFGFKSRIGGMVMAFTMLFAILVVHTGDIMTLDDHGGWAIELPMLYLIGGVAVAFLGSGKYSLTKGQGDWD